MDEIQFDVAFDWDGTLTSGDGPVGRDNGAVTDLTPLMLALAAGMQCAVMTCNEPAFVAEQLRREGLSAWCDYQMEHKVPPEWLGQRVLVTTRKVLARHYVDDRAVAFRFGDDPHELMGRLRG